MKYMYAQYTYSTATNLVLDYMWVVAEYQINEIVSNTTTIGFEI